MITNINGSCASVSKGGLNCTLLPKAHTTYHAHWDVHGDYEDVWEMDEHDLFTPTHQLKLYKHLHVIATINGDDQEELWFLLNQWAWKHWGREGINTYWGSITAIERGES